MIDSRANIYGIGRLERIFLFAKSEHADHRETVSRALPRWIEQVEVCEAVEYVLPLFEGLAADGNLAIDLYATLKVN